MANIVVDSSVVIKWFVVEPYSDKAREILDGYNTGEMNFFAPGLMNAEVQRAGHRHVDCIGGIGT